MQCFRCDGLMIVEQFQDVADDTGQNYFNGFRCLVCGEILDPMILMNRLGVGGSVGSMTEVQSEHPQKQLARFKGRE